MKKLFQNSEYNTFKKIIRSEYSVIFLLILMIIIASPMVPNFLTLQNLRNILTRTTILGMASIGMTFVMIAKGIDLSIGGVLIFTAYIGLQSLVKTLGINIYLAILIMLGIGAIIGFINCFSILKLHMPPFIATLAMLNITRGLSQFIYHTETIFNLPESWNYFATGKIIGLPTPIIIYSIVYIFAHIILKYTIFGRSLYAIGSNDKAAWLTGINVVRTTYYAYIFCGITAAITAVLSTSRLSAVVGNLGTGLELDVIAAVVIGGASFFGGEGTVFGALIGSLIIETLSNILVLARVNPFFVLVAKGLVLWVAVLVDIARKGYLFKKFGE